MSALPIPINNNFLVEIIDEFAGLAHNTEDQSFVKGRVLDGSGNQLHMTVGTGFLIPDDNFKNLASFLVELNDKVVIWQQYADAGQTFEQDNKKYALIPWWRIVAYYEGDTDESK